MYTSEDYFEKERHVSPLTKLLWWAAGADRKLLMQCSYSDHAKYFGLGGIVLATGILAAISGGYAFYTIFSPKEIQGAIESTIDVYSVIKATIFGSLWGMIIFNLDRFIISSSGIGDGSGRITPKELVHAIPRILMALVLSIAIAAPLEIRIFKTEIDAELYRVQNERILELNKITDAEFEERIRIALTDRGSLESEIQKQEQLIKKQEIKYQEEIAGRVSGVPGAGSAAKAIREYIDNRLKPDLEKMKSENTTSIATLNTDIESLRGEKKEAYRKNKNQAKKLDGLLQRLLLAEEIAGWKIIWLIRMIFIVIETGPIFFKMMVIKGPYDYLEDNLKEEIKARAGIISKKRMRSSSNEEPDYVYVGPQRVVDDKMKWFKAQNELSEYIVDQWKKKEKQKIDQNLDDYIQPDNNS
jgi:hypothetical protein